MYIFQEIRYFCVKHFPDGFGSSKVSSKICDLVKKNEFRKSFTSMSEIQKRLTDMGGFATLRKNKTMDGELSRKVESHHISKKLQGTSKISLKLRKYDNLSWQEFLAASRDTRVPLTSIPPRENLTIYLTGDTALSSLDVKTLKEVEKVKYFHRYFGHQRYYENQKLLQLPWWLLEYVWFHQMDRLFLCLRYIWYGF